MPCNVLVRVVLLHCYQLSSSLLCAFDLRSGIGRSHVNLPGSYRRVVAKPSNVSWKMMHYNDFHATLTVSDLDLIEGKEEPQSLPGR